MLLRDFIQGLLDRYLALRAEIRKAQGENAPWSIEGTLWMQADELRLKLDWLLETLKENAPEEEKFLREVLSNVSSDGVVGTHVSHRR